jgi:hypothetical protein
MIRASRSSGAIEIRMSEESPVRLVSESWWISIGFARRRLAIAYQRPHHLEWQDTRIGLVDHVALIRLLAGAIVLLSAIIKRRSS